jgi:uncharacterized membrane protein
MKGKGKYFLRQCLITGFVVWLPIWVVVAIIRFIFNLIDGSFSQLPTKYQPDHIFGHHIPGLGIVFFVLIVFLTGLIVNYIYGHYLVAAWERLMMRIPFVRNIYSAVKQMMNAFTHHKSESFRKVLLVEYPRKGVYSIGFQTSNRFQIPDVEDELLTVFIPTTPLPTAGFIILAPVKETIELKISVETAFKMIVSLGVVKPDEFDSKFS